MSSSPFLPLPAGLDIESTQMIEDQLVTPYRVLCVRRGTRPDIPDAVGKNLEGDSWIVVRT
jgi:hypothetical protein